MIAGALLRRDPAVASVVLEGEAVLLDPAGNVHVLSPSGAAVWEWLEDPTTTETLIAELSEAYGVPADVLADDVMGLLTDFRSMGLLAQADRAPVAARLPDPHAGGPTVLPEPPST